MILSIKYSENKEARTVNTGFASGGVMCKLEGLYLAPVGFSAGLTVLCLPVGSETHHCGKRQNVNFFIFPSAQFPALHKIVARSFLFRGSCPNH